MRFVCSKEPSQRDGPFEYLQQMFWLRNNSQLQSYLEACAAADMIESFSLKYMKSN